MKKVSLTLLAMVIILGALAGAGFIGYRIGYNQGASGNAAFAHTNQIPMPMQRFDHDFAIPRYNNYRSPMMGRGGFGINFFSPFRILWNIAILALIIWFVYWLFTKSGWQITRNTSSSGQDSSSKDEGN